MVEEEVFVVESTQLFCGICKIRSENDDINDFVCCENCGTYFHIKHVFIWLKEKETCPSCRSSFIDKLKSDSGIPPSHDENEWLYVNPQNKKEFMDPSERKIGSGDQGITNPPVYIDVQTLILENNSRSVNRKLNSLNMRSQKQRSPGLIEFSAEITKSPLGPM